MSFNDIFKQWVKSVNKSQYRYQSISKLRRQYPDSVEFTQHCDLHRSALHPSERVDFVVHDPAPMQGSEEFQLEQRRVSGFDRVVDTRNRRLSRLEQEIALRVQVMAESVETWEMVDLRRRNRQHSGNNEVIDRSEPVCQTAEMDVYFDFMKLTVNDAKTRKTDKKDVQTGGSDVGVFEAFEVFPPQVVPLVVVEAVPPAAAHKIHMLPAEEYLDFDNYHV
eukprot:gene21464-27499_t